MAMANLEQSEIRRNNVDGIEFVSVAIVVSQIINSLRNIADICSNMFTKHNRLICGPIRNEQVAAKTAPESVRSLRRAV